MVKVKNVYLIILLVFVSIAISTAQSAESHQIFTESLKKSNFKKLLKKAKNADVIFFGEMHNDPISHWLQLKLIKELDKDNNLIVGLEMFERDNQEALNNYLDGSIDAKKLEEDARLWNNYKTDYAPIVDYAKENDIKVIASNIPRTYASMVYKQGFESIESLVAEEKAYIAPLPIPYDASLPGYVKMLNMMEGHAGENFPKSQAVKDATMAYSINENYETNKKFVHLNGKYHSDNFEGIIWYLNEYNPALKVLTISTDMTDTPKSELAKADFIILVDKDMTKTY
ncbi:ChaN family lipoprotein [Portibacter lacus]|uniref:Haem-binding uptake Tiki superfamily ChaN domain-containing protein n=1 Tax=Portibacter lacus TaxID=1099794 RepID=A0AA37WD51_9BACT|nr:ChaN family lipoprotein [Portibacter lacus]GLR15522.1 hypothetical protein GCM10007940_01370 [Portibacter lacus]